MKVYLSEKEVDVIARALTSMDARTDETDAIIDNIREKLQIEDPYKEKDDG